MTQHARSMHAPRSLFSALADKTAAAVLWAMLAIALALLPTPASAGVLVTWSGVTGTNWGTDTNWSPTTTLSSGTTYSLVFTGTTNRGTFNNVSGTMTLDSLLFTNSGSASATVNLFTLSGNTLNFVNAAITTGSMPGAVGGAGAANGLAGDYIYAPTVLTGSNTVTLGLNHSLSLAGDISGGGSLTLVGGGTTQTQGTLYITTSNSYTGNTFVSGGFVATQTQSVPSSFASSAFGTGTVTITNATVLVRNSSVLPNNFVISGAAASGVGDALTGSFGVNTGVSAVLNGSVTLAGNATIGSAGTAGMFGNQFVLNGATLLGANTLTFRPDRIVNEKNIIVLNGIVSGTGGSIVLNSPVSTGEVRLMNANTYTGSTTINSGLLTTGNSSALGNGGALVVNTYGLNLNGISVNAGALSGSSTGVIQSNVAGAAALRSTSAVSTTYAGSIRDGSGTVSFGLAGSGTLEFTGSNSYTGTTSIDGGVLQMGSLNALAGGGPIGFGGGTLRYTAVNTLDYSSRFRNSGGSISIDTNGQQVTFDSAIASSNTAGLTKLGAGVLYLNAANQYTGPTTVASGTLAGTGSVLGPFSVSAGAVFDPGSAPGATTVFGVGAFSQAAGGTTKMQVNGTTPGTLYDQVSFSGTSRTVTWGGNLELAVTGSYANYTQFNLFGDPAGSNGFTSQSGNLAGISFNAASPYAGLSFGGGPVGGTWYTNSTPAGQYFTFNQSTGVLMVVPEPGTVAMSAIGLGLLCLRALRRRHRLAA